LLILPLALLGSRLILVLAVLGLAVSTAVRLAAALSVSLRLSALILSLGPTFVV
jgi:hypothetical protein